MFVGVFSCLGVVGVCYDFGVRVRYVVGVIGVGSGSVVKGNGFGWEILLWDFSWELYIVVFFVGSILLGNLVWGERRWCIGWFVVVGGFGVCYVWKGCEKEIFWFVGVMRIGFWCCVLVFVLLIVCK